jgi:hypothetical protein
MRLFLLIAGILACVFGVALLLIPATFMQPTGIDMTPLVATLPQAHGATLFGLGIFNILVRKADVVGLKAAFAGNLVVQVLSLCVVIRTMTLGPGMAVAPGIGIHVVLGLFCAYFLWKLAAQKA